MAEGTEPKASGGVVNKLKDWAKSIPPWGWVVIAGASIFVVYKFNQSTSTQSGSNTSGTDQGLQLADMAGIPYDFMSGFPPGVSTTPPTTTTTTANPTDFGSAVLHARGSGDNRKGLYLYSSPGGSHDKGSVPFGSTVTFSGPPQTVNGRTFYPLSTGGWIASTSIQTLNPANAAAAGGAALDTIFRRGGGGEGDHFSEWGHDTSGMHFDATVASLALPGEYGLEERIS